MKKSFIWKVYYKEKNNSNWNIFEGKKGFWYADPILINFKMNKYVFMEAFDMKKQIGRLVVSKYENGKLEESKIIMKRFFHLSYPCVFEYNDELYMIPETGQCTTLELWKCIGNIYNWKKMATLKNHVRLADTTVFVLNKTVYLISYEEEKEYITHIYMLNMSNYEVNEIEKIKNSSNNKRPAGKFFYYNQKLYRPVQNNIKKYGESVIINEIKSLRPFREITVKELTAAFFDNKFKKSNVHTLSFDDDIVVIDILEETKLPFYYNFIFIRKIRNLVFKLRLNLKKVINR